MVDLTPSMGPGGRPVTATRLFLVLALHRCVFVRSRPAADPGGARKHRADDHPDQDEGNGPWHPYP
ncbi:hypothetical protein ETD86_42525 [Nonomuraea turkmeniaca]|uniref:Uncharacterized protein n=1 Tax=Nonomuraea turkmeniaca TaxID=103838 RepID=A0A5S4F0V5_9ACTN|nr:hypothetical protein [Nonomuraea turkmeniaca]TMR09678.1 hypothetical protein ETD86_42525 [Nonomuraea turkmeniaca]